MNNPADEISQAERRRILAEDRKARTYFSEAQASLDDNRGGRFAVTRPTTVIGSSPIQYPRLPGTAPANQAALVGDEPTLGFSVNDIEPVGEIHERNERNEQRAASKWRRL
jgi:hypothetical protein